MQTESIGSNTLAKSGYLASNGVGFSLLLGRHPSIDRCLNL